MWFVYVDYTNDGRPFYVGKGDTRRVKQSKRNRKHSWVSATLGRRREIVIATSREDIALDNEIELIALCDTFTTAHALRLDDIRCNFTRGGQGLTGYKDTVETRSRKRVAALKMGQDLIIQLKKSAALKGRVFNEEHKLKMQRRRSVLQIDPKTGNIVAQYDTVKAAQEATGAHMSNICLCCRGKHKTAAGFGWRYAGEI